MSERVNGKTINEGANQAHSERSSHGNSAPVTLVSLSTSHVSSTPNSQLSSLSLDQLMQEPVHSGGTAGLQGSTSLGSGSEGVTSSAVAAGEINSATFESMTYDQLGAVPVRTASFIDDKKDEKAEGEEVASDSNEGTEALVLVKTGDGPSDTVGMVDDKDVVSIENDLEEDEVESFDINVDDFLVTFFGTNSLSVNVEENTLASTTFLTVPSKFGASLFLSYALEMTGDYLLFSLDSDDGELRFLSSPNYEAIIGSKSYEVTANITDSISGAVDTKIIRVVVTDEQDPISVSGTALATGREETFTGTTGAATVSYANSDAGVFVSLFSGTGSDGFAVDDKYTINPITNLSTIRNIIGSPFPDVLGGDSGDNIFTGDQSDIFLNGGLGNNTLLVASDFTSTGDLQIVSIRNITITSPTGVILDLSNQSETLTITGGPGADSITGGAVGDIIYGAQEDKLLDGGGGVSNELHISANFDDTSDAQINNFQSIVMENFGTLTLDDQTEGFTIIGSDGNDIITGGTGKDVIIGGDGIDTVKYDYAAITGGVIVNLANFFATGLGTGDDNISGVENIIGSKYNDILTGSVVANHIEGGAGDDIIRGGPGADPGDVLDGGDNTAVGDTLSYSGASAGVTVDLSVTTEQDTVGSGKDTILNFENLSGSKFDDTLSGDANNNVINGDDGHDMIFGADGLDTLTGGAGNDHFVFKTASESGNTTLTADVITDFTSGVDKIDISGIAGVGVLPVFFGASAPIVAGTPSVWLTFDATHTFVNIDTDGDLSSDTMIALNHFGGFVDPVLTDFIGVRNDGTISSESELEGTSIVHTVILTDTTVVPTILDFSLVGSGANPATAVTDYGTPTFNNGVTLLGNDLTIPAGVSSFTITIPTGSDTDDEPNETYTITMGTASATGTIIDDDGVPGILSISDESAIEAIDIVHTVTLTNTPAVDTDFLISFTNGTASGTDYTSVLTNGNFSNGVTIVANTITVPAGVTSFTVSVPTTDDGLVEADETYILTIDPTVANAAVSGGASGIGTIIDNDNLPVAMDDDLILTLPQIILEDSGANKLSATSLLLIVSNDMDLDGDLLTINDVGLSKHGSVSIDGFGDVFFTPAKNYSGIASFKYTVTDGYNTSNIATVTFNVVAVADVPNVNTLPFASGNEDSAIPLLINSLLADTDGSEVLTVEVSKVGGGVIALSAGTSSDGGVTWTLTPADFPGLTITPSLNSDADFDLNVKAISTETSNNDTAFSSAVIAVTVDALADVPTLSVSPASGDVDTAISLDITSMLTDTDGSEVLSIQISGVPFGASLNQGIDNGFGQWTLTEAQLIGLTVLPALGDDSDFALTIKSISTELSNGDTNSNSDTINVTVNNVIPPVVFDLNHDGINLLTLAESNMYVDVNNDGISDHIAWAAPDDGVLIYDANHNGLVDGIEEFSFVIYAPEAKTDMEALKIAFDTNHDSVFDAQDTQYVDFGIWQDANANGVVDSGEYLTLHDMGITAIHLDSDGQLQTLNGNTIYGTSHYETTDGHTGLVGDVALAVVITPPPDPTQALPDLITHSDPLM